MNAILIGLGGIGLNYDFKNIDELYLNEYENLPLNYD